MQILQLTTGGGRYMLIILGVILATVLYGALTLKIILIALDADWNGDSEMGMKLGLLGFAMIIAPIVIACLIDF